MHKGKGESTTGEDFQLNIIEVKSKKVSRRYSTRIVQYPYEHATHNKGSIISQGIYYMIYRRVEWRERISPSRSPKTGRDSLPSSSSYCPAL